MEAMTVHWQKRRDYPFLRALSQSRNNSERNKETLFSKRSVIDEKRIHLRTQLCQRWRVDT